MVLADSQEVNRVVSPETDLAYAIAVETATERGVNLRGSSRGQSYARLNSNKLASLILATSYGSPGGEIVGNPALALNFLDNAIIDPSLSGSSLKNIVRGINSSKAGARWEGALKLVGGTIGAAGSFILGAAASWTGVGAVAGGAGVAINGDVAFTGLRQLRSGRKELSFATHGLMAMGMSENGATMVGSGLELGAGFIGPGGLTRVDAMSNARGVAVTLTYKPGWNAEQIAAANAKVAALTKARTVKSVVTRSSTSASRTFARAGNALESGKDVDHLIDLQLGGADLVSNMWLLDSSVNRSLGSQIYQATKDLPTGTKIGRFTIQPR